MMTDNACLRFPKQVRPIEIHCLREHLNAATYVPNKHYHATPYTNNECSLNTNELSRRAATTDLLQPKVASDEYAEGKLFLLPAVTSTVDQLIPRKHHS